MAQRDLTVRVLGDSRSLERTLKRSTAETQKFGRAVEGVAGGSRLRGLASMSALLKGGGIAIGAGVAANQIAGLSAAASDLNEEVSKSRQVFGGSSAAVESWARTTASAMGIARKDALAATGTFGNLFNTVGVGDAKAADMSRALVQLAADLASFNNAAPTDVLDAIRSGLIGEAEPLRRYGVLLSEARVQQLAMADTGKTNAKALTDQEKALARYQIIMRDTSSAQGDFTRTSDGLANQQRILKARLADARVELGERLLPVMLQATEVANGLLKSLNPTADVSLFNSASFQNDFADAFGPEAFRKAFQAALPELKRGQQAFADALQPIPLKIQPEIDKEKPPAFGQKGFKVGQPTERLVTFTAEQKNKFFDAAVGRRLERVQDADLRGQLTQLRQIEETISARIEITKDITRKLNLEDELLSVRRQQAGIRDQLAQDFLDSLQLRVDRAGVTAQLGDDLVALRAVAAELRKRIAADRTNVDLQRQLLGVEQQSRQIVEQRRQARVEAVTARQFKTLGLAADGGEVTPTVENLRKRIGSFTQAVKGTFLDTSKTQSQLARFRKVLSETLVPKDVRQKMAELLADLQRQLRDHAASGGPLTKTTQLSADRILQGLGLGRDAERELRARLSSFDSSGAALAGAGRGAARGAGGALTVTVPVAVVVDGKQIATASAKYEGRSKRVNTTQRNGPLAGW